MNQHTQGALSAFLDMCATNEALQAKLKLALGGPDHVAAIANEAGFAIKADALKREVFRRWRCGELVPAQGAPFQPAPVFKEMSEDVDLS